MRRAMRALAEEGVEQLDFGWGDAEYKRRFGDRRVDEVDAVLFARRTLPSVAFAVARARTSVKAAADEASARLGLRTRLRDLKRRLRGGASEPT
jgi:CelD/BcsL family acetyltransferase involved in cellulose biosynthesis